jgi:hypothetical protein
MYCFVRLLLSAAVQLLLMNVEFGMVAATKHVYKFHFKITYISMTQNWEFRKV